MVKNFLDSENFPMFKRKGCRSYTMDSNYGSDSGTDDDLPLTILQQQVLQARSARARQPGATKRPGSGMHFDRFSAMGDRTTQELEMDAYTAVLRAFCAQSTALTWTKERLMCDLRKELRISEEQHRQLTEEFEARQARSLRSGAVSEPQAGATFDNMQIATSLLPPSNSALPPFQKNPRASHAPQAPLVVPVAPFQLPTTQSSYESSRSQASRGKGRQAPGHVTAPSPSRFSLDGSTILLGNPKLQRLLGGDTAAPSKDLNCEFEGSGREKDRKNLRLCRESLAAVPPVVKTSETQVGPHLGRRVQRLWPDDKLFYDAVIVDYDQESGRHALVYDMGTPQESYEWVNLKELAEGEVKFVQGPAISLLGRNLEPPPSRGQGRGRRGGGLAMGRGRGKSFWRTPVSAPARGPTSVKVSVGPGKTLRIPKEFQDGVAVKEIDLKERKKLACSNSSKLSVPELIMDERGGTTVKVPVISDIFAEATNLDEIVDLDKLANMKQKVGVIAEALRTALHDLGPSSDDDDVEDIKSSDEETQEKKTIQREKLLQ